MLPRSPLAAALFLWDCLYYGYTPYVHPQILRNGVDALGLPEWQKALALHPAVVSVSFNLHRWLVLGSLLTPLLVRHCVYKRTAPQSRPCVAVTKGCSDPVLLCTLAMLVGILLGINLTLERVRM